MRPALSRTSVSASRLGCAPLAQGLATRTGTYILHTYVDVDARAHGARKTQSPSPIAALEWKQAGRSRSATGICPPGPPPYWQRPSQLPAAPGAVALRPMPNFDDRDAALLPPQLGAIRMQQQPFEWAGGSCTGNRARGTGSAERKPSGFGRALRGGLAELNVRRRGGGALPRNL